MDAKKLALEYLQDVKLMRLATARDNQPWLCNVWYVMDDEGKIYWMSRATRRHSEEIAYNSKIACTFHKSFEDGLGQKGQAVVVSGQARQLPPAECEKAYQLYLKRYPKLAEFQSLEVTLDGSGDHKLYELIPEEIIWWDEENFPEDSRQQVL